MQSSGMKPTERKPLQKPKPCTRRYKGIKKRLIDRTPTDLTRAEIKGRDDRPCSFHISIAHNNLSYHILNFLKLPYFFKFSIVSPYTIPAFNHLALIPYFNDLTRYQLCYILNMFKSCLRMRGY